LTAQVTDRAWVFHLQSLSEQLRPALDTVGGWVACNGDLVPRWLWVAPIAAVGVVFLGAIFFRQKRSRAAAATFSFVSGVSFVICYGALLVGTLIFFDASMPLDFRLLLPLHAVILIGGMVWLSSRLDDERQRTRVFHLGLAMYLIFSWRQAWVWCAQLREDGEGYASDVWKNSELLAMARRLAPDTLLYTISPGAVYLYTGRVALEIPTRWPRDTLQPSPQYAASFDLMRRRLEHHEAAMLYFSEDSEPVFPTYEKIVRGLRVPCRSAADGFFCGTVPE
jgi:hypothetical protein